MTTLQLVASAGHDPFVAVGVLHAIRNAVIAFLVIVFLLGAVVGFLLARLIYRRGGSTPGINPTGSRSRRGFGSGRR